MVTEVCDFCLRETATIKVVHPYPFISDICPDCNQEKQYSKWPSAPNIVIRKTDLKYPTKGGCHV